jgi:hypothetical protein
VMTTICYPPLFPAEEQRRSRRKEIAAWIFERNKCRWCEKGWFKSIPMWAGKIELFLCFYSKSLEEYMSSTHLVWVAVHIPQVLVDNHKFSIAGEYTRFMLLK